MTESEAIAKFKRTSVLWESASNTEMVEAVKVSITALEEVQRYRAIGTVSEFRELKEKATEIREKAIEEFAEQIKARAHSTERNDWSADYMISIWESVIDEIAETMKGE